MFSKIRNMEIKVYIGFILVMFATINIFGCSNEEQGIINPQKGGNRDETEISAGELHNQIMKDYLITAYEENLFQDFGEEGWRIKWEKAKPALIKAYNHIMEKHSLKYRVNRTDIEKTMRDIVSLSKNGVDLFHQETVSPVKIETAVNAGFLPEKAGTLNRAFRIMLQQEDRSIYQAKALVKIQEKEPVVDILVNSTTFWKEVQSFEPDSSVGRENPDSTEDDIWDNFKGWWNCHKVQIREVFVGGCDAVGGAAGSPSGPGGTIAGAVLGTAAGSIAWPPYE
ncbi:MAG TPA: hypothetical protein VKO43_00900 [Candidatus Krumholzibacteriaceae bacterium]|nr:hypothetical protein [Candidatus Krumholzibacteriaceae bacterium]